MYLTVPVDTAPFDIGARAKDFVHGGNSLQERVIPVITVGYRQPAGAHNIRYQLELESAAPVMTMHRVRARIVAADQLGLNYSGRRRELLRLECADDDRVAVELCDICAAERVEDAIRAPIGAWFELFFRLSGQSTDRVRVRLRHASRPGLVQAVVSDERYAVTVPQTVHSDVDGAASASEPAAPDLAWLDALPAGGIRDVFQHISTYGAVNRAQAIDMLGSPRALRRFAMKFEQYQRLAPFPTRVDTTSGDTCYVRADR